MGVLKAFQMTIHCCEYTYTIVPLGTVLMSVSDTFEMSILSCDRTCSFIPRCSIFMCVSETFEMSSSRSNCAYEIIQLTAIFMSVTETIDLGLRPHATQGTRPPKYFNALFTIKITKRNVFKRLKGVS